MTPPGSAQPPTHRWVAFLRAINTGGRRIANEALVAPFVELGFTGVTAYQAAGNVVFDCPDDALVDPALIEAALAAAYGFEAPTFLRRLDLLAELVAVPPFDTADLDGTEGRVQMTFLREEPAPNTVGAVHELVPAEDRVRFAGAEWYWLPARGVADSRLPVTAIERLVGPMTMRTFGTVERLCRRFGG